MQNMNENPNTRNVEGRYRAMLIIWFGMLMSSVLFLIMTLIVKSKKTPDESSNVVVLALLLMSFSMFAASFFIKKKLTDTALQKQSPDGVQSAFIVGVALCEAISMFGVLAHFAFASPYHYAFFVISLIGLLLHIPRRSQLQDAMFRR